MDNSGLTDEKLKEIFDSMPERGSKEERTIFVSETTVKLIRDWYDKLPWYHKFKVWLWRKVTFKGKL